jgi:hypothetical protein
MQRELLGVIDAERRVRLRFTAFIIVRALLGLGTEPVVDALRQ